MINKLKNMPKSGKSAIVYTFSTLFSRGLAIITIPIFTRIMTTGQMGTVSLYNSWYALISMIATLSLTSGGYIVALKEFSNSRDEYESSVLSLTSIIAIGIAALYFVAPSFWERIIGLPKSLLMLMLVGFMFAPARDFWLARQRYEYKYKTPALITILSAIFASLASVVIVLRLNNLNSPFVAEGRLFANYFVIYGVCAVLWFYIMRKGKTYFNKQYWKLSLQLSIPLIGYAVASQILGISDRMMISKLVGNSAVGVYGVLYTVSSLSTMVWSAIHSSFVPYLFQNIEKEEKRSGIKRTSFYLLVLYAVIAILLTFFAPEIVKILATSEYYEAIYIMPPIAAGIFFTSYANMYSDIAVYYKKTQYVMIPTAIAAGVNIILNYVFIKLYGYVAAAYTTLVSYMLLAFLQALWARKICRANGINRGTVFDDKKLFLLAIVTTISTLTGIILYRNTLIRFGVLGVSVIAVAIVGWFVIKKDSSNSIINILKNGK